MDKTLFIHTNISQRRGFALMVTLSILAVVISLTAVLLGYFTKVQKEAHSTTALIQANIYYADILTQFNKFKDKKVLFDILYITPLPLNSDDGRFSMNLICEPLSKGVNINWLSSSKTLLKDEAEALFEMLAMQYNLRDAGRLLELIKEEIGKSENRDDFEKRRLHKKEGIISFRQFEQVLSLYQFESDDDKVGEIPWDKYFSFSLTSQKIDAEYASAELIAYLFDLDIQSVKEWTNAIDKSSLAHFVTDNGGDFASKTKLIAGKKFLDESVCEVHYGSVGEQYSFRFEYIRGEAKHFEFYGKY
jgi:hypothetical protein